MELSISNRFNEIGLESLQGINAGGSVTDFLKGSLESSIKMMAVNVALASNTAAIPVVGQVMGGAAVSSVITTSIIYSAYSVSNFFGW